MMAYTGSFQVSHDLGVCNYHRSTRQYKNMMGRDRLHLWKISLSLSSHGSRLDALSLRLSDGLYRPSCCVPSRHKVFKCHSLLTPGQANEIPILKTALTAMMSSYKIYRGSPLILQLVPAVAIVVFAVWGLGPLMRHSRNLFLHRSDSSWKKSSTHYVMTSYLQPLLLWTGAALVCRALDPIVLPSEASQIVKQRLLNFVRSLSTVLAFAYCLSSLIEQTQKFLTETNASNDSRNMGFQFAGKAVYTAVWVAAVSLFMELLGFSTQKWLTAGGLGTVLLTLAGREIFTNFLSSAMIHATRPFIVNEWIQTKIEGYEVSGTVEHVGWWSPTIIRGEDREAVHIPNHKFTVNVVRNLTQKTHWRIKTHLAISHLDVSKINSIVADMRKVLAKNPQVEQQRLHRRVFLENINAENQALLILISCFVKTSHFEEYLCVKEAILLDLLRVISHHRARLATPIRTVQKVYSDADIDNIPFSETIYSRPRAANNRPFLLIEPSYKINGDEKSKSQVRPMRKNEENDPKVTVTSSHLKTDGKAAETSPELRTENKNSKTDSKVAETLPELKTDIKVTATSPNSQIDPKVITSSPDNKADSKIASGPAPPSSSNKANPKVAAKSGSDVQGLGLASDGSVKKNKQTEKVGSSDAMPKGSMINNAPTKTSVSSSPKSKVEVTETVRGLDSQDTLREPSMNSLEVKSGVRAESATSAASHAKQESEKMGLAPPSIPRPALEDNIVLGVALDGSKRTLPIEEELTAATPTSSEEKELAACSNGNDKKEGQVSGGGQRPREQEK